MIINKLPSGGSGFELPPYGSSENFIFSTYDSNGETYVRIEGFDFIGWTGTSVSIPSTLGGYQVKQISNEAFITGDFGTLSEIVIPFEFIWYYETTTAVKQRINSQLTKITANFPAWNYTMFYNSNITKFDNNVIYNTCNLADYKNTKFSDYRDIVKYMITVGQSSFAGSNCKGNEFVNLKTLDDVSDISNARLGAFEGCQSIINANFPELEVIGSAYMVATTAHGHFSGCSAMNTFRADKLATLGFGTFTTCISLKELYLPSLTSINFGTSAARSPFYGCDNLTAIYTSADNVDNLKAIFTAAPFAADRALADLVQAMPA